MSKFPVDAPIGRVVSALQRLGFTLVREGNHISMLRKTRWDQYTVDHSQSSHAQKIHPSNSVDSGRDFQRSVLKGL